MNYAIPPVGLPALQSADPLTLEGMGRSFPLTGVGGAEGLSNVMNAFSLDHPVMSLTASHHLNPLDGLPDYSPGQLKQVSQNFESIFMRMMFKEMRDSVQKSGLFGEDRAMDTFQSMYDDQLSDVLSASGGMGIGRMVYQQLEKAVGSHLTTRP